MNFIKKKQKSTKVGLLGLLGLGLGLFAVSIVLASNLVGAAAIGAFIGELFGWTIIKTSVLGYAIIGVVGVVGVFGLGLVGIVLKNLQNRWAETIKHQQVNL